MLHTGLLALRPSIYGVFGLLSLTFESRVALGSCDLGLQSLALELILLLRGFKLLFALKLLCLRGAPLRTRLGIGLRLLQPALARKVVLAHDLAGNFFRLTDQLAERSTSRRLRRIGVCHCSPFDRICAVRNTSVPRSGSVGGNTGSPAGQSPEVEDGTSRGLVP